MRIRVLFFGQLKDVAGRSEETLDLPAGSRLETVFRHYASQFPKLNAMAESIATARNGEFSELSAGIEDGDEVALMPPVSGGAGASLPAAPLPAAPLPAVRKSADAYFAVTADPIDSAALGRRIQSGGDGALLTFEGVVRNNFNGRRTRWLDYECYVPLALKTIEEIGRGVLQRFDVRRIAVAHRVGRLAVGETSVAIVVAAAHRRDAYEASRAAIDTLKKRVPVWKKEYFENGEIWVEGQWDDDIPRSAPRASAIAGAP